ncbi:hypothetical protein BDY21DRAFT_367435 [Lineolata rhizophorae]|uniref:Uncharacterized protein n=1 Tax=Lineolata rhizophorae TaxID=578093 RepID=A0A6A6NMB4_9PEZI|nr:hypothetical protein BDY21DRAFT_367435 [Lineolata rhizophorae]
MARYRGWDYAELKELGSSSGRPDEDGDGPCPKRRKPDDEPGEAASSGSVPIDSQASPDHPKLQQFSGSRGDSTAEAPGFTTVNRPPRHTNDWIGQSNEPYKLNVPNDDDNLHPNSGHHVQSQDLNSDLQLSNIPVSSSAKRSIRRHTRGKAPLTRTKTSAYTRSLANGLRESKPGVNRNHEFPLGDAKVGDEHSCNIPEPAPSPALAESTLSKLNAFRYARASQKSVGGKENDELVATLTSGADYFTSSRRRYATLTDEGQVNYGTEQFAGNFIQSPRTDRSAGSANEERACKNFGDHRSRFRSPNDSNLSHDLQQNNYATVPAAIKYRFAAEDDAIAARNWPLHTVENSTFSAGQETVPAELENQLAASLSSSSDPNPCLFQPNCETSHELQTHEVLGPTKAGPIEESDGALLRPTLDSTHEAAASEQLVPQVALNENVAIQDDSSDFDDGFDVDDALNDAELIAILDRQPSRLTGAQRPSHNNHTSDHTSSSSYPFGSPPSPESPHFSPNHVGWSDNNEPPNVLKGADNNDEDKYNDNGDDDDDEDFDAGWPDLSDADLEHLDAQTGAVSALTTSAAGRTSTTTAAPRSSSTAYSSTHLISSPPRRPLPPTTSTSITTTTTPSPTSTTHPSHTTTAPPAPPIPPPFARPPFPAPLRDRSPLVGATPRLVLRTCFRTGEAVRAGARAARAGRGHGLVLELGGFFGRV